MLYRTLLCLFLAISCNGAAAATTTFELIFANDRLIELHTEDLKVCRFGDTSCYPDEFEVGPRHRSPLAPFAGLSRGDRFMLEISDTDTGDVTCNFGGFFDCGSGFGYNARTRGGADTGGFQMYDWSGDVSITADLNRGSLRFFGAAGSYAPNGCNGSGFSGARSPEGFCDFFGYEADFQIVSIPVTRRIERIAPIAPIAPITPIPLPNALLLLVMGLLSFAWIRRSKYLPRF